MMKHLILFTLTLCFQVSSWADDNLKVLISPEQISERIKEVAARIDQEYAGKNLTIVTILKGSICVTADLIRAIHVPFKIECITASSYGRNGVRSGKLTVTGLDRADFTNEHVLVVDDIFDSGKTMVSVMDVVRSKNPEDVQSLVLLLKNVPHVTSYRPEFVLFDVEDRFVVGYGLDYKEYFRGLPGIYAFISDTPPTDL